MEERKVIISETFHNVTPKNIERLFEEWKSKTFPPSQGSSNRIMSRRVLESIQITNVIGTDIHCVTAMLPYATRGRLSDNGDVCFEIVERRTHLSTEDMERLVELAKYGLNKYGESLAE